MILIFSADISLTVSEVATVFTSISNVSTGYTVKILVAILITQKDGVLVKNEQYPIYI